MLGERALQPRLLLTVAALCLATSCRPAAAGPAIAGCPVFPDDHALNTPIDTLPVHPRSAEYVQSIGPSTGLHPDFGSGTWLGAPIGIPFTVVPGSQPPVPVTFGYAAQSDPGPYPIPANPPIEGGPSSHGDRHVLIVDRDACRLYELYAAYPQSDGSWDAGSGATFDLRGYALRPETWTSADAAGLPIFPVLVRFDEVASGEVRHAIRFTANVTQEAYVWPARHEASSETSLSVPPMGQRFRLKASVDISGFPFQARVILQAMKTYGVILADNGSDWYISGAPDPGWDDDVLVTAFRQIHGSDFEAVDASSLMIDPSSARARPPAPPVFTGGVWLAAAGPDASGGARIMTGAGHGGGPRIRTFAPDGTPGFDFFAYAPSFVGGVRVAICDVTGDRRDDLIVAAGPGGGPHVQVFDGVTGQRVASFFAYDPSVSAGLFVACGDVLGLGIAQIVTAVDAGGGPHVRVFHGNGADAGVSFFAYQPDFRGGVRVAVCNLTGSGRDEIVTAAGPGGGPHVRVFDGLTQRELASFFAYAPSVAGGIFVACGDVGGAPRIVTGADAGGGPHVRAFHPDGSDAGVSFYAYIPGFKGGVRVAVADLDGDGRGEIVTAAGAGGGPHVRTFTATGAPIGGGFFAY
jgi:hypothetical protein